MITTASSPPCCWTKIAFLDDRIAQLGARAAELTAVMPEAWGINADDAPARTPAPPLMPRC